MRGEVGGRRGGEGGGVGRNPTALPGGQPHEGVSPAVSQVVRRQERGGGRRVKAQEGRRRTRRWCRGGGHMGGERGKIRRRTASSPLGRGANSIPHKEGAWGERKWVRKRVERGKRAVVLHGVGVGLVR